MPDGILIIDKGEGWTSMDVCAKLRGIFHERRVGHAGTLDPMATGVLPVFIGRATRAVSFAEAGDKEYVASLLLGTVTDTQDTSGRVLSQGSGDVPREAVEAVLPAFTGEILQVPPMYSAIKKGGKKLYELARAGQEVERAPRPITVYALEILEQQGPCRFLLRIRCSKGTYVRTLCHDIGAALGCGGCMAGLRRTMAAGYTLEEAVTLEQAAAEGEALLRPVDSLFAACPAYTIPTPRQEERCRCGNPLPAGGLAPGTYRVYGRGGDFLCLSRVEGEQLVSIKNFFGS